jgi:hypothetical protein
MELEILDEKGKVINKKAFNEVVKDIFEDDIPYKYEEETILLRLLIEKGDKNLFIKLHDYLTDILMVMMDIGKDYLGLAFTELLWLYVENDHVLDDPQVFHYFFISDGIKILKERVVLSGIPVDLPENLLQVKSDYFTSSDHEYETARVRRCYEKFYRETEYGQLVALKEKNEFEMDNFGRLLPEINNASISSLLLLKINQLQKQLRFIGWLIFIIIILVVFALFK